jgi:hypothetical protein
MNKRLVGLLCMLGLIVGFAATIALAPSPAPQAAPPCLSCPLQPLPDECPPCYQFVPQTCRKCASCERIKGCHV